MPEFGHWIDCDVHILCAYDGLVIGKTQDSDERLKALQSLGFIVFENYKYVGL